MSLLSYRPEIDGLRAIAVLTVLLCHAGISGFSGGYIGVDVFFVISGFLITSLIVQDLQGGRFSFVNFWERRCRRILPPAILVMTITALVGWFLLLPHDYAALGQQMAAQSVFASNILFKMQEGYFAAPSQTKALLHTWSLAVEEQFYLLFPTVLFVAWKYRPQKVFLYLAVAAVITFIAATFIVRNSPSSAFYLLPFRAWELLLGSLLALKAPQLRWSPRTCTAMSWAGLLAILLPVLLYNDDTLFPGLSALPPCLGTALIIAAQTQGQTIVGRLLAMRVPVFIGLISYSLYLWHWPVIVFVRYSGLIPFTPVVAALCMALSFILALLTWHFVEKPVRRRRILSTTRQVYTASLMALIVTGTAGLFLYIKGGIPQRLSPAVVQLAAGEQDTNPHRAQCDKPDFKRFAQDDICQLNPGQNIAPTIMVWGDSMADALAPAFFELAAQYGVNGYVATAHGCPPMLGYAQRVYKGFDCPAFNQHVFDLVTRHNIKQVFLLGNWTDHFRTTNGNYDYADMNWYENYKPFYSQINMAALKRTIELLQAQGVRVYVVVDTPYAPVDPPRLLSIRALYHLPYESIAIPLSSYLAGRKDNIDTFMSISAEDGITFIDPREALCNGEQCLMQHDNRSLYYNQGHMSAYGAHYLAPLFAPYISARRAPPVPVR